MPLMAAFWRRTGHAFTWVLGGHVRLKVAPGLWETGSDTWFTGTCVLSDLSTFGKADCVGTLNNASIKDGNTCFERIWWIYLCTKSLYCAHKYTNKRVKKYQTRLNIFSQRVKVCSCLSHINKKIEQNNMDLPKGGRRKEKAESRKETCEAWWACE